jgi:hypothetical protein
LDSQEDDKNVRINSRNYTGSSGDSSGVQIKPSRTVTGTASVTGLEVSPRFQAGIAGANLIAIKADPLLKAGTGDLSGSVAAIQANLDFGTSGTRTIAGDVSAFETFLAIPSTYTYSGAVSVIRVRAVNIKAWDYFLNFDDASTGACAASTTAITSGTNTTHRLKCLVGSTVFYLLGVAAS